MPIELAPPLEAIVREQVASGRYADAGAALGEALHLLEEHDRMARLRAAIAVGIEQVERGEVVDWTPEMLDRLIRESDEDARLGRPITDDVKP